MVAFRLFDTAHVLTLLGLALLAGCVAMAGRRWGKQQANCDLRWPLALLLLGNELYLQIAAVQAGDWRLSWALPLHLCDLSLFALVTALLGNCQVAWEIAYYWGIGGSLPALITPDLPLGFPHYTFITFFIHHGAVVIGVCYLAAGSTYPLPFSSVKRIWILTHVYAGAVAGFNIAAGTNYLFLCGKPGQPSILDYLGPWPYYLLGLEILFSGILCVLYGLYHAFYKAERQSG